MHRFFLDPELRVDGLDCLSPDDAKHALTVLRLKEGSPVEVVLFGRPWTAEIVSTENHKVFVRRLAPLSSNEASLKVTLFQGLPKAEKMDWIVQKATELGVSRIVPVLMHRTVVRLSSKDCDHKMERWNRIIRESCKQSCRCVIPELCAPVALPDLFSLPDMPEITAVPWEEADHSGPLAFHRAHPALSSLGILIGPEGGITSEEISFLSDGGFVPITLGKRILRTETAGLAAVSAFMTLYGEMD